MSFRTPRPVRGEIRMKCTSFSTMCGEFSPGAEPPQLKNLLDRLRPLSYGLSVCGAGGGGFVVCITKSPGDEVYGIFSSVRLDAKALKTSVPRDFNSKSSMIDERNVRTSSHCSFPKFLSAQEARLRLCLDNFSEALFDLKGLHCTVMLDMFRFSFSFIISSALIQCARQHELLLRVIDDRP